jgi:tetratricopeptide (TPR) repeat protein
MCAENRCRTCGNAMPNGTLTGLCPVCLFREGLAGDGSAVATGPFMSGTQGVTSALATFDKSLGGLPHVLLRDSELNDGPGPVVQPGSPEMPAVGNRTGRLQLLGEIARGGMGAVLKGRDPDLGRDLAVKVLLESHRDKPDLIRRFFEEAQIGGQLQHPGIVPIYELGAFADHRPYFAMKLVKGRTLSSLLDERSDQVHDLPRFLSIFESVCQTIAYAHARGVIHRDLKPSNIMIGSFGEVQVMDWGLAKVLPQGGVADDVSAGKIRERETVIATARSGGDSDSDLSRAGSVMGTPSYMAPEQARGEVDRLDERCDVFALGSILCEILTGEPAFIGRSSGEIQRKASRGELKDALDRLNGSGSDVELIALAKDCLATELEDRPRHAGEIAAQIISYQTGVQERLRRAEIARAEEKARAEEATKRANAERDRQRLTVALAASVIALIVLGVSSWGYVSDLKAARRAATERVARQAIDEANLLRGQAKAAAVGDLSKWAPALAAAKKARSLVAAGDADADLQNRVKTLVTFLEGEQADAEHRAAELDRDREFVERLEEIRLGRAGKWWSSLLPYDEAYAKAFREFGIDPDHLNPDEAGSLLSQRSDPVEITFFLDDWAMVRRMLRSEKTRNSWQRLVAAARATDTDPFRDAIRAQIGINDRATLSHLIDEEMTIGLQPARSLFLLAEVLRDYGYEKKEDMFTEKAHELIKRAWSLKPNDFAIYSELGQPDGDESGRYSTAAVALKPENAGAHHNLAIALFPEHLREWTTLPMRQDWKKGTTELAPGLVDESISEHRRSVRLQPQEPVFHFGLAVALLYKHGESDEALAEIKETQLLIDRGASDSVAVRLSFVLFNLGKHDVAIALMREQVRQYPGAFEQMFAIMLQNDRKWREAIDTLGNAARLPGSQTGLPQGFLESLANGVMERNGTPSDLVSHYRESILRNPRNGDAHNGLGYSLLGFGEVDTALSEVREALRAQPKNPNYLDSLGWALFARGELKEALANLRDANRLSTPPSNEIGTHLNLVERLSALEGRLVAILCDQDVPADAEGKLDVADLCRVTRRFAASAKFYRETFLAKPTLVDDLTSQHRLHAAIAAVQASTKTNPSKDDIHLDDAERARWRAQGLDWLRAQKDAFAKMITPPAPVTARPTPAVTGDSPNLALARKTLDIMTHHRDLACVRVEKELAKLPEPERKEWQAFWSEVAALLKKADRI